MLTSGDGAIQSLKEDYTGLTTESMSGVMAKQPYGRSMRIPASFSTLGQTLYTPIRQMQPQSGNGYAKDRRGSNGHDGGLSYEENSGISDADKDDHALATPYPEKQHYARSEQRSILIRNLSDRTTHKDIVDIVRGGALLDIYLRVADKSASVSFVEGSAAQAFMNYAKRNDIYIHGKRVRIFFCEIWKVADALSSG